VSAKKEMVGATSVFSKTKQMSFITEESISRGMVQDVEPPNLAPSGEFPLQTQAPSTVEGSVRF